MASKAAILAGKGYVELSVDQNPLQRGLNAAAQRLKSFGVSAIKVGASIAAAGAAIEAALSPSINTFANYEQALANLRAAANPTAADFARLRATIESVGRATGTDLVEVTASFSELVKAGRSAEEVVGGLGMAVVQFSRVSEMTAPEAVATLTGAMNVFSAEGLTATETMNIMNSAADASRVSLRQVSEAFTNGGAAAVMFNQTMRDTATAIAIMGQGQVEGADAGTSLRRVLANLGGSAEGGESGAVADSLGRIGLSFRSFRDETGRMLPMVRIIEILQGALSGLNEEARSHAIGGIGGMYGQTGLNALLRTGTAGFRAMQTTMSESLTVEEKFAIMTDTFHGAMKKLWVQIQLISVAIGEALVPAMRNTMAFVSPLIAWTAEFIRQNQYLVQMVDYVGIGLIGLGIVVGGLGAAIYAAGFAFGVLASVVGVVFSPWVIGFAAVAAGVYLVWRNFDAIRIAAISAATWFEPIFAALGDFAVFAGDVFRGIGDAISAGDWTRAAEIAFAGLRIAWLEVIGPMTQAYNDFTTTLSIGMVRASAAMQNAFQSAMTGMSLAWSYVVQAFQVGWNVFRTSAEVSYAAVRAAATFSSPAEAIAAAQAEGQARHDAIIRNAESERNTAASRLNAERARIQRELLDLERNIDAGRVDNAAEISRLRSELESMEMEAHFARMASEVATDTLASRRPQVPGTGGGGIGEAIRGSIASGFANQGLLGALGASGGGTPLQRQIALAQTQVELAREMVSRLRDIERVAGARMS